MFEETKEGQTHYYGDGCGELEYNTGFLCGKLEELKDKTFSGGCGKFVPIFGSANESAYRCVDCTASFHRNCLRKHFKKDTK